MSFDIEKVVISNHPEKSRYEASWEKNTAVAEYMDRGEMIVFTHTEVPKAFEGKGVASKLVKFALEEVRAQGKTVMPLCPYVAAFIRRHSAYQDLVLKGYKY